MQEFSSVEKSSVIFSLRKSGKCFLSVDIEKGNCFPELYKIDW